MYGIGRGHPSRAVCRVGGWRMGCHPVLFASHLGTCPHMATEVHQRGAGCTAHRHSLLVPVHAPPRAKGRVPLRAQQPLLSCMLHAGCCATLRCLTPRRCGGRPLSPRPSRVARTAAWCCRPHQHQQQEEGGQRRGTRNNQGRQVSSGTIRRLCTAEGAGDRKHVCAPL